MLTEDRRWISGAAIYLRSQAGNSGERIWRYSRAVGVRGLRQRFLQVRILMVFSELGEKILGRETDKETLALTRLSSSLDSSESESSSSSVSDSASATGMSGTGMVAFLPVGRSKMWIQP